jgi:hypothetical protein
MPRLPRIGRSSSPPAKPRDAGPAHPQANDHLDSLEDHSGSPPQYRDLPPEAQRAAPTVTPSGPPPAGSIAANAAAAAHQDDALRSQWEGLMRPRPNPAPAPQPVTQSSAPNLGWSTGTSAPPRARRNFVGPHGEPMLSGGQHQLLGAFRDTSSAKEPGSLQSLRDRLGTLMFTEPQLLRGIDHARNAPLVLNLKLDDLRQVVEGGRVRPNPESLRGSAQLRSNEKAMMGHPRLPDSDLPLFTTLQLSTPQLDAAHCQLVLKHEVKERATVSLPTSELEELGPQHVSAHAHLPVTLNELDNAPLTRLLAQANRMPMKIAPPDNLVGHVHGPVMMGHHVAELVLPRAAQNTPAGRDAQTLAEEHGVQVRFS